MDHYLGLAKANNGFSKTQTLSLIVLPLVFPWVHVCPTGERYSPNMNSSLKELWPKQKIDITGPRCARENKNEGHGFLILMS